ncbi:MAG: GNAT family N-acetyltransferase [Roseiflexus sp.]|jgi:ribosomal protein S18 acetylase RimI-like enzyme|uniref:GNAT family N-acetyltransferase n=1 Tax=Roseiflexus sp. TaxID=2562120 RepID=UPI0025E6D9D3|nr:GNAT family N-acetyltransferase [Roseiflexus sp.]MCL6541934.1 GNAT family N-acetyltransferase [Roseiflexus sp.]
MTMQTDAFVVRPLTLDDLDALLPLVEALHTGDGDPFDPQRTVDALQLVLSHPEYGVVHVAVVGETIAGYIVGSLGLSIEAGGRFLLVDELYVSPAWRGQGLARALLASLIPYAQSHHCRVVELEVGWENDRARTWYERLGFERHRRFFCSITLEALDRRLVQRLAR